MEKPEGITACGPGRGRQAQPRAPYVGASENILGKVPSESSGEGLVGGTQVEEMGEHRPG